MMLKVEKQMYNGRLSKSFWKGPAEGRCYNSIVRIAFIIMLVIPVFVSCSDNRNQKQDQKSEQPMLSTPTPVYEKPLYIPPTASVPSQKVEPVQKQRRDEAPVVEQQTAQPTVTISKYYEKGYDAGYDDGEDDAVMDNGWGGQFDDSCPYKGKARKDYQLGYEEGYEAGYYDNKDGDE